MYIINGQFDKENFKEGEHCQFCKVKATCCKRAEYNLELAKYDFEMPLILEEKEVAAILAKIDSLISWAADIKEYTLQQALSGAHYEGFKIVEGRANRKYTDDDAVAFVAKMIDEEDGEVKVALQFRQQLTKSSVKKYNAMQNAVCADGRARGMLQFYGANRPEDL